MDFATIPDIDKAIEYQMNRLKIYTEAIDRHIAVHPNCIWDMSMLVSDAVSMLQSLVIIKETLVEYRTSYLKNSVDVFMTVRPKMIELEKQWITLHPTTKTKI